MLDHDAVDQLLGINERNLHWVFAHNKRKFFPLVDDKITTKRILTDAGLPVPETLEIVDSFLDVDERLERLSGFKECVVKPSKGRAGGGILLLRNTGGRTWKTPSGRTVGEDDLVAHFGEVLFGVYSFGSNDDRVLIEELLVPDPLFLDFHPVGVADIRVILFRSQPVMAMARIPTRDSDGKANLHQGAVGVGLDLSSGAMLRGTWKSQLIAHHPDSGKDFRRVQVPHWNDVISVSIEAARNVELNYLGVDIVLEEKRGPLILELNARPGLAIQLANETMLKPGLETLL
jgi:alpha-L-glutamate ligase-like protein